jgi:hypothetical protein
MVIQRGQHSDPLPDSIDVVRLADPAKDTSQTNRAHETHFELSSKDKESPLQSLSVWASELTPPLVARTFMGPTGRKYTLALHLDVSEIRRLTIADKPDERMLDVVWDHLEISGAEGHAGLVGLKRPPQGISLHYRALRAKLAKLARVEILPE